MVDVNQNVVQSHGGKASQSLSKDLSQKARKVK